jgi:NAD(P) transhydrogenase subunit alpha
LRGIICDNASILDQSFVKLHIVNEIGSSDYRVAITPEVAQKLIGAGHNVLFEPGAGSRAGFPDSDYLEVGCELSGNLDSSEVDVIFSTNPLNAGITEHLKSGTIVISPQEPFSQSENIKTFAARGITAFALDLVPRITRAQYMDILSSQANLAGYKAIVEAAHLLNRALPLMMTTAGTIPAAKVLVIGAGVAGLQAIATARRLGAIVSAFDVRVSAKEQVESLGAKFIEVNSPEKTDGVYAKEMTDDYKKLQKERLLSVLPHQDIIITTAQIPGKRAPVILEGDMVDSIKRGAVLIDLASKSGGNCALTEHGKIIEKDGALIVSFDNILNLIPHDSSRLFSKNIFAFCELLTQKMKDNPDISAIDDEIIRATLLTYNGKIVNNQIER